MDLKMKQNIGKIRTMKWVQECYKKISEKITFFFYNAHWIQGTTATLDSVTKWYCYMGIICKCGL